MVDVDDVKECKVGDEVADAAVGQHVSTGALTEFLVPVVDCSSPDALITFGDELADSFKQEMVVWREVREQDVPIPLRGGGLDVAEKFFGDLFVRGCGGLLKPVQSELDVPRGRDDECECLTGYGVKHRGFAESFLEDFVCLLRGVGFKCEVPGLERTEGAVADDSPRVGMVR